MINCIGYADDSLHAKAQLLAKQLHFKVDKEAQNCLFVDYEQLSLKIAPFSLLSADFSAATWLKRKTEGKKQAIIRACKPARGVTIIDATAGWGRDAAVLASFGSEVLMLERHPIMATLLNDALLRQSLADKELLHLSLLTQDAASFLSHLKETEYPDVIYLDPMHPERSKAALVKKEMQVLQAMIGADEDALALMHHARPYAKQRMVVKWPQKLKPLLMPDMSIPGKTVRFDIYLNG